MSQSFGASLREARERKGISLRQIATATKISVAALESLERDDFSKLPGGIFSRSFVRSYAIEVGLDPDETVQRFLEQLEPENAVDAPTHDHGAVEAGPQQLAARHRPAEITSEFEFESRQRIAAVVLRLVVASIPIAAALLYFSSPGASTGPSYEPPPVADRPVARDTAKAQPVAGPVAAPPAPAPQVPVPASNVGDEITLEIAPSGDCWAQLTADGAVVVSRLLKAGERERRTFHDAAVLQVGDGATCAILINGRPARPLGPAGKVRQIRITRDNYTTFVP